MTEEALIEKMERSWSADPRWADIERSYSAREVYRLRGTIEVEHSLARQGATRLWNLLHRKDHLAVLSAVTGNQAVQQVRAGLEAVYVSGWQVAADMNDAMETYPDQSIYPSDSGPQLVKRINNALRRANQIHHLHGDDSTFWMAPVVADAEAGFGGVLNVFEIMKQMIDAGAAGVHLEDQLSSVKKCGHLGGKVLVPTREFVQKLTAARLAADVSGVDTVLIARTDAGSAGLLTNASDSDDHRFLTGESTPEGFFRVKPGAEAAIARGLAYAPYADMLWFETQHPDLQEAKAFAEAIHERFPGKLLAYNCSPSFNWRKHMDEEQAANFQNALGAMGYQFQFVTLSGFHSLNYSMFMLARAYRERGMAAYSELQCGEFEAAEYGYDAGLHQEFAGAGYFDIVAQATSGGYSSTLAMEGSTEKEQFVTVPEVMRHQHLRQSRS